MSRIGRTCSVPTDACAYHVPRVPCFANTCVSRSTYSARCSSGTAQSSMNDTGLPSPFMLIMMLSPALRTSHSAFCAAASVMRTTLPGKPRSPISSTSSAWSSRARVVLAGELDQQDRLRLADQRASIDRPERRIAAREIDHRAIDELDRRRLERDDVLRAFHRAIQRREIDDAERSMLRQRRELAASARASTPACLRCRPADAPG